VIIGGQASATGGLLQRRREVLQLDSQRISLTASIDESKQRREQVLAQGQELREQSRQLVESLRDAEMQGSHCGKTKPDSSMRWEIWLCGLRR